MAAITHAVATINTANTNSYASAAFTPAAGDLLVAFVVSSDTVAAGSMTNSAGLTFTKVTSAVYRTSLDTVYVFVANAAATAVSQTCTFSCTGDNATGAVVMVARVSGMSRYGSSAIKQSAVQNNGTAATTPAPTFGTAADTNNTVFCVVGDSANPATITQPSTWTEYADTGYATPTTGAQYSGKASGFTGTAVTAGGASASNYGAIAIELDTSAPPAGSASFFAFF